MKKIYQYQVQCSNGCQTITNHFDEFTEYQTHAIGCNGEFTLIREGAEFYQLGIYNKLKLKLVGFALLSKSAVTPAEIRIKTSLVKQKLIERKDSLTIEEVSDNEINVIDSVTKGLRFVLIVM